MKISILINANTDGTAPTITVRYTQGFAFSSAIQKSNDIGDGGTHRRLAVMELYEDIDTNQYGH